MVMNLNQKDFLIYRNISIDTDVTDTGRDSVSIQDLVGALEDITLPVPERDLYEFSNGAPITQRIPTTIRPMTLEFTLNKYVRELHTGAPGVFRFHGMLSSNDGTPNSQMAAGVKGTVRHTAMELPAATEAARWRTTVDVETYMLFGADEPNDLGNLVFAIGSDGTATLSAAGLALDVFISVPRMIYYREGFDEFLGLREVFAGRPAVPTEEQTIAIHY